jgi:hypothetical protein
MLEYIEATIDIPPCQKEVEMNKDRKESEKVTGKE